MSKRATKKKVKGRTKKAVRKVNGKASTKVKAKLSRNRRRPRVYDVLTITFPQPGPQECFPPANFTASGTTGGNTITRVRLFTPDGETSVAPNVAGTNWTAVFPGITSFPPGVDLRLLVEGTDGSDPVAVGITFSQNMPPAPRLTLKAVPAADFSLTISGKTVDVDDLTVTVDGDSVDPQFNSATNSYSFTTPSAEFDEMDVVFHATNNKGGDSEFSYTLPVDVTKPAVELDAPNPSSTEVQIDGQATDDWSGFTGEGALNITVEGALSGGVVVPRPSATLSADHKTLMFTISVKAVDLQAALDNEGIESDQFTVTVTADDLSGNTSDEAGTSFNFP